MVGAQARERSEGDIRERREKSAQVGARQAADVAPGSLWKGAILAKGRLGRRIARGGRERGNQAVFDRNERTRAATQRERRSADRGSDS